MKRQLQKVPNTAAGFVLKKYTNINDVINIKQLPIDGQIEHSLEITRFKAIYDENVPNHLKLTQKIASSYSLQSNNKRIFVNTNQTNQQTGNISNNLPRNIQSVEVSLVFKSKVKRPSGSRISKKLIF